MTTSFGDVKDPTLAKLCDAIAACLVRPDGTKYSAAPDAFSDRLGKALGGSSGPIGAGQSGDASEVTIEIRINPGGTSSVGKIILRAPQGVNDLAGYIDIGVLATKLA